MPMPRPCVRSFKQAIYFTVTKRIVSICSRSSEHRTGLLDRLELSFRLRLHEEKQQHLQRLRDSMRTVARLETQLRALSSLSSPPSAAAAAASSSSSSLGSLSSSHASSKGSLSSLSFTDIYGLSNVTAAADPGMLDLHRRVDKILNNPSSQQHPNPISGHLQRARLQPESGLQSADDSLMTTPESESGPAGPSVSTATQSQQLSLSPRSSLSSASPPVSPQVDLSGSQQQQQQQLLPPSYETAYLGERQRRIQVQQLSDRLAELGVNKTKSSNKLSTIAEATASKPTSEEACGLKLEHLLNQVVNVTEERSFE